jgi:hypothetical protein
VLVSEHASEDAERDDDGPVSVPDEDLPEDLQPSDDNPLAQPAGDDVPEDLLTETAGGHVGESSKNDDDSGED